MTTSELQLSAIQMLCGLDNKQAETIEKIWAFINNLVNGNKRTKQNQRKKVTETDDEWTKEQEREAFLYTSKVNAAKLFAKYL
ncbi:MAG: hypothetical protein II956_15595 [Bacteroidales bacterium]|nr:hypothetical protein [Bacteroidales bacterium]